MLYKNKKTGVIIDAPARLSGNWEPVEAPKAPAPKKRTTKK